MELGEKLKATREENNISLDTLQETTKIQKRYLLAIEQGNFHLLPGKFYARAFIKEYALAVGLDPDELLKGHQAELPETETTDTVAYTRMQRTRREESTAKDSRFLSVLPSVIVVLLIIGIIFVAYTLSQKSQNKNNTDPVGQRDKDQIIRNNDGDSGPDQNVTDNNDNEENENNENNESNENDEDNVIDNDNNEENDTTNDIKDVSLRLVKEGTGAKPESTYEISDPGDKVVLTLEPSGESWLDVKTGDEVSLYSGFTAADEKLEFDITDEERVWLNIGSSPNVPIIKINDLEVEYPFDPNQYFTQRIWINLSKESE